VGAGLGLILSRIARGGAQVAIRGTIAPRSPKTERKEGPMSVLVQMRVRVDDVDRFKSAYEQWLPQIGEMGGRSMGLYSAENDPNEVSLLEEWESHDHMHKASEKYGDQFNETAGTAGKDWETRIWHKI
jgi:quinol monooxygenase YgiN